MRRVPSSPRQQRGAASVVIAILFLVIAGYAVVAALDMSTATVSDATLDDSGSRAHFLAESGLERGVQRFKAGTQSCAGVVNDGPYVLGGGQFWVESYTPEPPDDINCRITARGQIGNAVRSISGLAAPGNYDFWEHFPSDIDFGNNWTESIVGGSRGNHGFSTANCNPCTGDTGGSLYFRTRAGGKNHRYRGYVQRNLDTALASGSGITVRVDLGYWKAAQNNRADAQTISVMLVSSATGSSVTLWSHSAISNAQTWIPVNRTVALPASQTYDLLRVEVDLREDGNRQVQVRVDEIRIQSP